MSFKEVIFFRIPQQLQQIVFGRIQQKQYFKATTIQINHNFVVPNYSVKESQKIINKSENIFSFNFFQTKIDLSKNIDWLKDYKNDITSTHTYYAKINRQNFEQFGDIKYVCELSRFYFLPFLALHHTAHDDKSSISVIETTLKDWINQNPYLNSIHWTSGIEIGIRSVNLIYTHLVLLQQKKLTKTIDENIKELIQYNYQFLKNHLSLYSSANNHLVAELTGLVAITSYFESEEYSESQKKWQEKLYKEIENQVNDDGVNVELSTHYHAEVTDLFLNALLFIKRSGKVIPKSIENRFKKMFNFINHVEYSGNKTIFGDNDEGYLLYPYFKKKFSIYNSLLMSSDIEYDSNYVDSENIDLRNYLIYGETYFKHNEKTRNINTKKDTLFKSSGYGFFYNEKNRTKLSVDFGAIGDNVSAAHGHSDIFHFMLEIKGIQILVDSGTYQYHKKNTKWREYFRGIKAHNTVSINSLNQAISNSRMSWIEMPNVKLLNSFITKEVSYISTEHDAYKRQGIKHKREFKFEKNKNKITIIDSLTFINKKEKEVELEFYFNFNPKLDIIFENNKLTAGIKNTKVVLENPFFKGGELIKGNENKMLGWFSEQYDRKTVGQVFVFKKRMLKNMIIKTEIKLDE